MIRPVFVSALIHPMTLEIIRMTYVTEDRDYEGDSDVFYHLYSFDLMTRGAAMLFNAILYNKSNISPLDREGPIYNRLLISLINRVHLDRNKLFHLFDHHRKANCYLCLNRKWYHYWEMKFHQRNERDTLYCTIYDYFEPGDLEITERDLYLRDRNYVKPFEYHLTSDSVQTINVDYGCIEYFS